MNDGMMYNDEVLGISSILSENRRTRPNQFLGASLCPFCLENASEIEIVRNAIVTEEGDKIQIVNNKYPACSEEGIVYGIHDVIIETQDHHKKPEHFTKVHWKVLLQVIRDRWITLSKMPRIHFVQVFKNEGERAGASIGHPHSQIIALEEVPCTIEEHYKKMEAYFRKTDKCRICQEIEDKDLSVLEQDGWQLCVPEGASVPYETWIIPKKHISNIGQMDEADLEALAYITEQAIKMNRQMLGEISYNMCFMNGRYEQDEHYHFFIKILPRTGQFAGFELATGCTINVVNPKTQKDIMKKYLLDLKGGL